MSNVFKIGDRVSVKEGNNTVFGKVIGTGVVNDFEVELDDKRRLNFPGAPITKALGTNIEQKDVIKIDVTGAPVPTVAAPAPPTVPSTLPTVAGPLPTRLSSSYSFSLSRRPFGRRSYDIDTAVAPAAGSTTIPPPVFRSPDSTLSFLTPRSQCRKSA